MFSFYIILSAYVLFLGCILFFYRKPGKETPERRLADYLISVVIPVRNEPELDLLLNDLKEQNFPKNKLEVIIVDDHSDENVEAPEPFSLIKLSGCSYGKKAALTAGINMASGDIIVTIDGDCRISSSDYLKNISQLFSSSEVVLSPGLVKYDEAQNLFQKMQSLEIMAIMGVGVGLSKAGYTSLSNGANLAFRKDVWQEVGGYKGHENIPSGDDELFVQRIDKLYPEKIIFRTNAESCVSTRANSDFINFFNQRIRWAGKWKHYSNKKMSAVAAIVFLFHIGISGGLIALFASGHLLLLSLFMLKSILEYTLIKSVAKKLNCKFHILSFIILQFLYSPYVVFFGITSNFVSYKWKERKFRYS